MYNVITDQSQGIPAFPLSSNLMNYSLFKELYCKVPFRSFSIKYVVEGLEKYTINGKDYFVESGQYVLANQYSEGTVFIKSSSTVKGLCIDLDTQLIAEVVGSLRRPDTPFADLDLDTFFSSPHFLENQYCAKLTHTGQLLAALSGRVSQNPFAPPQFTKEVYFRLAEKIVLDHQAVYKQLREIPSIKTETRKDLIRRIHKGKAYIDTYFNVPLDIAAVARESNLSEYHFFRLFKIIFKESPYQYIIQRRLSCAAEKIKSGHHSLSDIAFETGFSDIAAFSKSFKHKMGVTPSVYQKLGKP